MQPTGPTLTPRPAPRGVCLQPAQLVRSLSAPHRLFPPCPPGPSRCQLLRSHPGFLQPSPFLSPTRAPGLLPEQAGPIRVMPGVSASDRAQGQRAQLGCERGHAVITPTPRETTASMADLSTEGWPHLARPEGGTGSQPGSTAITARQPTPPSEVLCTLSSSKGTLFSSQGDRLSSPSSA